MTSPNKKPASIGNASSEDVARIIAVCRHIDACDTMPPLAELAALAGLSAHHFHRLFRRVAGVTPRQYAQEKRADRVRASLATESSVTGAALSSGFNSNSRFYDNAGSMLGMPPRQFQRGGDGVKIHFAIGECSLGNILVAQSERGICAILFGDDADALLKDFQNRFPRADLAGSEPLFEKTIAQVIALIDLPGSALDLPLDIRGTAFQQRVWLALREIPPGKTVSYSQLAERLGMPGGARAVAGACAANHIAVAIPCHRVVRNDGGLSGYRWGIARKRSLLEREAASAAHNST